MGALHLLASIYLDQIYSMLSVSGTSSMEFIAQNLLNDTSRLNWIGLSLPIYPAQMFLVIILILEY